MPALTCASERLAPLWVLLGTAALAAAVLGVGQTLAPPPALAAAGVAALLLSCRVPGEGLRLCGPVAGYELVRATRQRRILLWRALVAGWLLFAAWNSFPSGAPTVGAVARFGGDLAEWILFSIWAAVPLAALRAGSAAVAEDRERHQLDLTLVTDLRGREVVFGRLLAGLAEAGALALVAIPVLALVTLFGGADPAALACSLALLCSSSLAIAGLATWVGARSRSAGQAAWRTVAVVLAYLLIVPFAAAQFPWLTGVPREVLLSANPFASALYVLTPGWGVGSAEAWRLARPVLAAHLVLFLVLSARTAARLRAVASASAGRGRAARRGRVPDADPVVWRERPVIARASPGWALAVGVAGLIGVSAGPGVATTRFVQIAGFVTVSFHLLLLARAVAARFDADGRTEMWDLLRLTDLNGGEILAQKGRAAWLGGRRGFLIAVSVLWAAAAAFDLVAWWAIPALLALTHAAQAGAVALGLWLGATMGPRGRAARAVATIWLLLVVPPLLLADSTSGATLALQPAGGVFLWTWSGDIPTVLALGDDFDLLVAFGSAVGTALVLPAAWWLRRRAAAGVRPNPIRPPE